MTHSPTADRSHDHQAERSTTNPSDPPERGDNRQQSTGRAAYRAQTGGRVRAKIEYAGRGEIDSAIHLLRRNLVQVAKVAAVDDAMAAELCRLVEGTVAELHRLAGAADRALLRSDRAQAEVGRQLAKARKLLRRAASPAAREIVERQVSHLEGLLAGRGSGAE
jgi:hypothetical protein